MRPPDTSPEAWKVFLDRQRSIPDGEKLKQVLDYSWFLVKMSEAVLKAENPGMSDREAFLRVASRRLNPEMMRTIYGWDPATQDYVPQSDHHRR
jgi:hypothetical protein